MIKPEQKRKLKEKRGIRKKLVQKKSKKIDGFWHVASNSLLEENDVQCFKILVYYNAL